MPVSSSAPGCTARRSRRLFSASTNSGTDTTMPFSVFADQRTPPNRRTDRVSLRRFHGMPSGQVCRGKPRSTPRWMGSGQRLITTLGRVKKCTPSGP